MPAQDPERFQVTREMYGGAPRYVIQRPNQFRTTIWAPIVRYRSVDTLRKLHTAIGKFLVEESRAQAQR